MVKIKVKNSGSVNLKFREDYPDGNLFIAEAEREIPFKIKRIYFSIAFIKLNSFPSRFISAWADSATFVVSPTTHQISGLTLEQYWFKLARIHGWS